MICKFILKNGESCKAKAMKNNKFCFFHAPEKEEERKIAIINGGLASRKNNINLPNRKIRESEHVVKILEETLNLIRSGKVHPNFANSIFLGSNTLLKALEQSKLEKTLSEIEARLEKAGL